MNVQILQPAQKMEAVDILAAAFHDYPLMRFVFQDAGEAYDEHVRQLIDFMCETRFRRQWPLFGLGDQQRLVAIAVVSQPGNPPVDPVLDQMHKRLHEAVGEAALGRFAMYDEASDRCLPACPHHYLGMIGVRPDCHRRGYGRQLVREIQCYAKANQASEGLCLNTETESNLPFYRSLGFHLIAETDFAHLHTWCFFWP